MTNTIIVGISGPSASGKTLLSNSIMNELGSDKIEVISEDSYYKCNAHLSKKERSMVNYDHPKSLDHELLCNQLCMIKCGSSVNIPIYNHSTHSREKCKRFINYNNKIIILEGILIFSNKKLRDMMDIRIFMDTQLDICLLRRLRRDTIERKRSIESVLSQYETTVRPMYWQFIEPAKCYADIIIPKGGRNKIALNVIKAKMRELLV